MNYKAITQTILAILFFALISYGTLKSNDLEVSEYENKILRDRLAIKDSLLNYYMNFHLIAIEQDVIIESNPVTLKMKKGNEILTNIKY